MSGLKIMVVPAGEKVGLTTVSLGLVRALHQQGLRVNFFKPVGQPRRRQEAEDQSTTILKNISKLQPATPLSASHAEAMISDNNMEDLLEQILALYEQHENPLAHVTVIEGLVSNTNQHYTVRLNREIANALGASLLLVQNPANRALADVNHQLEIACDNYGGHAGGKLLGCVFNKIGAPQDEYGQIQLNLTRQAQQLQNAQAVESLKGLPIFSKEFRCLGAVTWNAELNAPRALDLQRYVEAELLTRPEFLKRRIRSVHFCAREIHNLLPVLKPGALLVISADRSDVIVSACLAALNGTKLGALLLTGSYEPNAEVMALCEQAFETGLPVLKIRTTTWETAIKLQYFNQEVPTDDLRRISRVMDHTASCIDEQWVRSLVGGGEIKSPRLSPSAFRYKLTQLARAAEKTIVLPEGEEPRTIAAAAICAQRGIARCVLLGNRQNILRVAALQAIELPEGVIIESPETLRERYIEPMVALRKAKGLTPMIAAEQLMDNNVLGTMMLQQGDVSGLVSGAIGTTANTIRPALQLIKTAKDSSLVSSIFFMLLPDQVLVYGDCAINPDPDAAALAEIAIQSADSAKAFGIEPKVAMISYSTGESGSGQGVDKVKAATQLAQQKRPDLLIDGPLQYDAAIMESVARSKAPNSPVAGKATVFVFPDLNTGNTTYKAVQRSANLVSIGPMLQGLRKPVNDLSRGALIDDIVYTIALTAIQAAEVERAEQKS